MSGVYMPMKHPPTAREQAEVWFARLLAPDCSAEERAAFERWRLARPANAAAYVATERLWQKLDGLENDEVIGPLAAEALQPEPMNDWTAAVERRRPQASAAPPRRRWHLPAALAATLLVAALGLRFAPQWWPQPEPQHYRTAAEISHVTLADGSRMQMDVATQVDARLGRGARDLQLLQGRAIFEVAHDATRPFVVRVGTGQVTALGTRFQVDREGGQIAVTLMEGKVAVSQAGAKAGSADELLLAAGEQAVYSPQKAQWSSHKIDTGAATSWAQGFHTFSATPLAEAVREINRYSPHKLRLADPSLSTLALSGNFKTGDADAIASVLPEVLPVQVARAGDEIVLTRR